LQGTWKEFKVLVVVSLDIAQVTLRMPWLKIHNLKTNWADGECIFQGDPVKVESISIKDFLDGVREDPGQVF
jgi:hypothetical protein